MGSDCIGASNGGIVKLSAKIWKRLEGPGEAGGGAGGIRTLDTGLPYTHFPGVRLRPLGHCSAFPTAPRLRRRARRSGREGARLARFELRRNHACAPLCGPCARRASPAAPTGVPRASCGWRPASTSRGWNRGPKREPAPRRRRFLLYDRLYNDAARICIPCEHRLEAPFRPRKRAEGGFCLRPSGGRLAR